MDEKDLRQKIIDHAKTKYCSSPIEFTEEELDTIIKCNCECSNCYESIFSLEDYPVVKDGEVYCEDCYNDLFTTTCPVCEERYNDEHESDYFFITKETRRGTGKPVGLYHVTDYPFFHGDCVTGFDDFFDDRIEQINDLDIDEFEPLWTQNSQYHAKTDIICPDCAEKYRAYENLFSVLPLRTIYTKKYGESYRGRLGSKEFSRRKRLAINIDITLRGMLERANNPKFKKVK